MTKFCSETMNAISTLLKGDEGYYGAYLVHTEKHTPEGEKQSCDHGVADAKWVNEHYGGGFFGDDYSGTITWLLGSHYLIVSYST